MQNILDKHSDIIWMINDVECNDIKQKAKLIAKYNKKYVITHNLGIIDRNEYLDKENAIGEICSFIKAKRDVLVKNGVNQNNIYFDVGFGFGKKAETAIYLLDNIEIIKNQLGLKTLVGHSRKASVLGLDKNSSISKLDNATKELSKKLQYQNIEIIRIHRI
jgi:2-amino-4-hydroxy-6-hydroxymethyldihydropteridine diphosphokinase/dihydropteroate synthase